MSTGGGLNVTQAHRRNECCTNMCDVFCSNDRHASHHQLTQCSNDGLRELNVKISKSWGMPIYRIRGHVSSENFSPERNVVEIRFRNTCDDISQTIVNENLHAA